MTIRTFIIAAIASLGIAGTGLGDFWPTQLNGDVLDDNFGYYVSIEGGTCMIGTNRADTGSVHVYTSDADGNWSKVAEFNGEAFDDNFGSSIDLDGDTCVIGAEGVDSFTGRAYIYVSDASGAWSPVTELNAETSTSPIFFGRSVAIDGSTCVIGAPGTDSVTGSAYVYALHASGAWIKIAEFNGDALGDKFGNSVDLAGDICVIGAYGTNSASGSAYIYAPDASGTWSQVIELKGEEHGDHFGRSVAIDGDTCVIGAYETSSGTGSAYIYAPDASGIWTQVTELNGDATEDLFGTSVSIDGDTCMIGAPGTNSFTGSTYVYTSDASGTWSQVAELTAPGGADGDWFGRRVDIDGSACVIGAFGSNLWIGSAYIYGEPDSAPTGPCCIASGCIVSTRDDCTAIVGTWLDEGDECADCPASCAGDTNGDGVIDIIDLLIVIGAWGLCP